jgi:hypothetical protein
MGRLGQVMPVVAAADLVLDSLGHLAELLAHDSLVGEGKRFVMLLFLGRSLVLVVERTTMICLLVCQARVLVGVDIVKVVGLRAELNHGIGVAELLDQKTVLLRGGVARDVVGVARDQCTLT